MRSDAYASRAWLKIVLISITQNERKSQIFVSGRKAVCKENGGVTVLSVTPPSKEECKTIAFISLSVREEHVAS